MNEACWKGYKQVGMKKKGNRTVPNCVKKNKFSAEDNFLRYLKKFENKVKKDGGAGKITNE